jgi:hypothetical protein
MAGSVTKFVVKKKKKDSRGMNPGLWGVLFVSARLQMLNVGVRGLHQDFQGFCQG